MGSLPRPLLAVLLAVIAVFAAWTFVLKPKSSSSSGGASPQAVHQALSTAVGSTGSAKHATTSKSTTSKSASSTPAAHPTAPAVASHVSPAQRRVNEVTSALESGKVLALLFYNPAAPDDQADVKAVLAIPSHHGKVARVAVPVSEISRYSEIVDHVPVQSTPTLLVIDTKHRAQMLIGFADQLEYNQLVAGALKTK